MRPLIWVECTVERHSRSRTEYLVKARSQFKERSSASNVEISLPLPPDAITPTVRASQVGGPAWGAPGEFIVLWAHGSAERRSDPLLTPVSSCWKRAAPGADASPQPCFLARLHTTLIWTRCGQADTTIPCPLAFPRLASFGGQRRCTPLVTLCAGRMHSASNTLRLKRTCCAFMLKSLAVW